ncbi:6-hydroxymethyl-7,8-dihydropterin pyrophosphokinase [Methanocaldococcus lauensis]|uniref:6-hydroxymethyl-7,8-dihydropterin pyrophosphokinase n=1 Tax=Methanocaldococcus lauensis TaxID=2546128 RepID=A0A8D6PRP2_9EURY|nr:6-hydroxymethylpterin diphosphokinase MptE-like protein [Methanocaldococcus lauensis]CAB3287254.1 6-hydroxymethyl-7,8-dihydropterin pyrophosphokinase [Methanocaldococcus lauensis]
MDMKEWEKFYNKIIEDFGFDKNKDIKSAIILNNILENADKIPIKNLKNIIEGKEVFIFGAGPSLKKHIKIIKNLNKDIPIIVADGASKAFLEEGIIPDIIVSDLDGDLNAIFECNKRGSIIVVHAHGDNIDKIKKYVPKLKNVVGSCQIPNYMELNLKNLVNFGGFTDGDRCCFLAYHFKAKKLILGGMDFGIYITKYSRPNIKSEIEIGDEIKIKKLKYAEKLINYLKNRIDIEFLK